MEVLESQERRTLSSWQDGVIAEDILAVERILEQGVRSEDKLPQSLATRLVAAGGKRIRPLLMCLCYRSQPKSSIHSEEDLHTLAAVAEWVHTATLFHDDVLDASPTRRNMESAHVSHGNKVAILVGDFVYAEAFAILMERGLLEPSKKLANTIKRLVEGELWQHSYSKSRRIRLEDYERVAECKTAALFAWATETGVWLSGSQLTETAFHFGRCLGVAFQMADDLLDTYRLNPSTASSEELVEWMLSAPPLPLCIAHSHDPSLETLWRNTQNFDQISLLRDQVTELQHACCRSAVVSGCEQLLNNYLEQAHQSAEQLGSPKALLQAIELLRGRAQEGLVLARNLQGKV